MADADRIAKFWTLVEQRGPSDCWPWLGSTIKKDRRGCFTFRGRSWVAPRVMWTITNGEIPDGLFVCHSCDNPNCVNPAHLWLGTCQDNALDSSRKGRNILQKHPERMFPLWLFHVNGEKHPASKLTEIDVREIWRRHKAGEHTRTIARLYPHVSYRAVHFVVKRRTWKHVEL